MELCVQYTQVSVKNTFRGDLVLLRVEVPETGSKIDIPVVFYEFYDKKRAHVKAGLGSSVLTMVPISSLWRT